MSCPVNNLELFLAAVGVISLASLVVTVGLSIWSGWFE
jgi:hypothetical protein